jgi:hypothetical protein
VRLLTLIGLLLASQTLWAGSATLSWTPPTENTDGSPLTDLAGYRVYWECGTLTNTWPSQLDIPDALVTSEVMSLPDATTCWFSVTAYNEPGLESDYSNVASKVMAASPPNPPTGLTTDAAGPSAAFTFLVTQDFVALIEVGSVPAGTPCNGAIDVNGHYLVPRAAVTWLGSVRPEAVFALCSPD